MNKITYNKQYIDNKDVKIVVEALKSKHITSGSYVYSFEKKICKYLKVKHAISCVNGTAGLDLAFRGINLLPRDNVIMPVVNFIASYSMAKKIGANIFLADVDAETGQMTPDTLIDCINKNKIKKIKAVVTMYLGGYAENVINFYKLKKKYKFFLIEDACHAFGAKYQYNSKKVMVGSCKHSDISVFSFHPVKTITTAEGGIITTDDKLIASKIKLMKSHNIIRSKKYWDYDIKKISANYRLSDLNCALGISQLQKINMFLQNRKKAYLRYVKEIKKINTHVNIPKYENVKNSSFHLFLINLDLSKLKSNKDLFFKYLNKNNIFPQFHYKPLYMFSFFKKKKIANFTGAKKYFNNTLSIPLYYGIKKKEQEYILKKIKKFIDNLKLQTNRFVD